MARRRMRRDRRVVFAGSARRRSWRARVARALAAVVAVALVAAGLALASTHRQIRALDPPLPPMSALREQASLADLPVRVSVWNTASQPVPRGRVLDAGRDPAPARPYTMSHPAFVLEWADGRTLLVDAGMDRAAAIAFGAPLRWVGAGEVAAHGALAERLGPARARAPLAIALTHLHTDHVQGVSRLCRLLPAGARVRLFESPLQAGATNHTTRPGRALLDAAGCIARERLADAPLAPVPGHPGAFVLRAAGHTPGSQIVGAFVAGRGEPRGFLFAGDVANAIDGVRHDVPKPLAYRLLVVPESERRLAALRAFLRAAEQGGLAIVLAHDERHLASLGIPVLGERVGE